MTTRTSKKQMHEAEKVLRDVFPNDRVYAAGERDATRKAYILHNGEWHEFPTNGHAYDAIGELVFNGVEF